MIPHKSRAFRAILDLSFELKTTTSTYNSVNGATTPTAPQQGMVQLGQALKRLIGVLANHHNPSQMFVFSKLDIKDGFWRMSVSEQDAWNFCYVLPSINTLTSLDNTEIVVPEALQMGWCESPPFFCAGTETARDIIATLQSATMTLPPHPLEHMLLPTPLADNGVANQATTALEVYVDDFFAATNDRSTAHLRHLSRALLHGIHAIFPPPAHSGHNGEDPVSLKKLRNGDGIWAPTKEILGWLVNGQEFTIQLPQEKAAKYNAAIKRLLKKTQVPLKDFQKVTGKLQHASIGMPGGAGLFSPFYMALKGSPDTLYLGRFLKQALSDWTHLFRNAANEPTSVLQLVEQKPNYIGYCDACKFGAGGVWINGTSPLDYHVWQFEWPPDVRNNLKTADNRTGTISINDMEMAGLVLQWLALECLVPHLHNTHIAIYCNNASTVQWAFKMAQSKSLVASFLLRALGLRMHAVKASLLQCLPIAGTANNMADEASRQVPSNPAKSPAFTSLTSFFNKKFPLQQPNSWNEFRLPKKLTSRITSCLRGKPLTLASWLRLPAPAHVTGTNGSLLRDSSTSTRSSKTSTPSSEISWSQPLLRGSGVELSAEESKSLLARSVQPLPPSARPSNWLDNKAPSTGGTKNTPSPSNDALKE